MGRHSTARQLSGTLRKCRSCCEALRYQSAGRSVHIVEISVLTWWKIQKGWPRPGCRHRWLFRLGVKTCGFAGGVSSSSGTKIFYNSSQEPEESLQHLWDVFSPPDPEEVTVCPSRSSSPNTTSYSKSSAWLTQTGHNLKQIYGIC